VQQEVTLLEVFVEVYTHGFESAGMA